MQFWVFFCIVFAGFAFTGRRTLLRNAYLMAVSLLFYYKTSGLFVGLLLLVTCSDFLIAQRIYACRAQWRKRLWLTLSVAIDLGILCYFKYSYFFADIVGQIFGIDLKVTNVAAEWFNAAAGSPVFSVDRIILPVGISFYTFQVISYTADVYRGLIRPVRNILDFGFYVSFFPQLVAGPIVKASDFIPQLYRPYFLSRRMFGIAIFMILGGLAKKIILSDYLALNFVDRVFANPLLFTGFENTMALFVYSLQVYADFSGYTDIAIGLSLLMGFHLPRNFNSPYKAQNCSNFWKRWHISLSRWLQNYLYIPLGGNRSIGFGTYLWIAVLTLSGLILSGSIWVAAGTMLLAAAVILTAWRCPERRRKIYANLNSMITMLLGGLWHGASLNFLIWGGLNGVGMVVYKFWRDARPLHRALFTTAAALGCWLLVAFRPAPLWRILLCFIGFIAVSAWGRLFNEKLKIKNEKLSAATNLKVAGWSSAWSILVTFTFISFTRLFFRSGSNLDPASANQQAWQTASEMVTRIGSRWSGNEWAIISTYRSVFLLFLLGMIIHWLPEDWKRRYRLAFASLPLPVMSIVCILAVFIIYQFVSAEMQPFIYFQF
ncbi:MAG: MBOAT family protein [Bacteroidaceae bacterium]|nr:MBOAT family protein [Bacteroidaceae bacterium]